MAEEPMLGQDFNRLFKNGNCSQDIQNAVHSLLEQERYAVLASSEIRGTYTCMVAFCCSPDGRYIYFCTPSKTRKADNLANCPGISLLIDNRRLHGNRIMNICALTALGKASVITAEDLQDEARLLLVDRHPQLRRFISQSANILFEIEVHQYVFVQRFQEVWRWQVD